MSRTWDDYLYPGTNVLRNLGNHSDPVLASTFERANSHNRMIEYELSATPLPTSYDAEHVKAVHRHLFQDVYDWAGEYREVNLSLPTPTFTDQGRGEDAIHFFSQAESIDQTLRTTMAAIRNHPWERLSIVEAAEDLGSASIWLNHAHPFRDGNGRTIRVILGQLAERTGHRLDFDPEKVSATRWRTAHALAHIGHAQQRTSNTGHLIRTLDRMLEPTAADQKVQNGHPVRLRQLLLRGFDVLDQQSRRSQSNRTTIAHPPPTQFPAGKASLRDTGIER